MSFQTLNLDTFPKKKKKWIASPYFSNVLRGVEVLVKKFSMAALNFKF
jgi:hypothetical protein